MSETSVGVMPAAPKIEIRPPPVTISSPESSKPNFFGNFNERLGIKPNDPQENVRQAFLRLAKEYHPDNNKDPNAEGNFQLINEAYQLLKDPEARAKYNAAEQARMDEAVERAKGASNIMGPQGAQAFTEAGFKEVTGKDFPQLTQTEIVDNAAAAAAASAEKMLADIQSTDHPVIARILSPAEAQVFNVLTQSKEKSTAEIYALLFLLMAIINMIQYFQAVVAKDAEAQGRAFDSMGDNASAFGGIVGPLSGASNMREAVSNLMAKYKSAPQNPAVSIPAAPEPQVQTDVPASESNFNPIVKYESAPLAKTPTTEITKPVTSEDISKEQQIRIARAALVAAATLPRPVPISAPPQPLAKP